MKYDHNRKAGNEGDIVKHVALMASINSIADMSSLADWSKTIDIPVKHLKPINK